jgi:Type IV pilin-like G and H, putative
VCLVGTRLSYSYFFAGIFNMRQYRIVGLVAAIAIVGWGCSSEDSPKMTTIAAEAIAIESGAKSALNSLLFDQQTYFMENDKFATSLGQLESGLVADTPTYRYNVTPQPNNQQAIAITATSKKPNLRSFIGVAFALKAGKEELTITQICETNTPSKKAPIAPAKPKRASDQVVCPAGSRNTVNVVAAEGLF